jgi:tetratricopeptide (TPR) repeat protein
LGDGKVYVYSLHAVDVSKILKQTQERPNAAEYAKALKDVVPDIAEAVKAAKLGQIEAAEKLFLDSDKWPGVDFGDAPNWPETQALALFKKEVTNNLEAKATQIIPEGDVDQLDVEIQRATGALSRWPSVTLDASMLMHMRAGALATRSAMRSSEGQYADAIDDLKKARELDPKLQIPASELNLLCWMASVNGLAREALFVGDLAVQLDSNNLEYRDTRGLARALSGDRTGAVEDFTYFSLRTLDERRKQERLRWIKALKSAEPVSEILPPSELQAIRDE